MALLMSNWRIVEERMSIYSFSRFFSDLCTDSDKGSTRQLHLTSIFILLTFLLMSNDAL